MQNTSLLAERSLAMISRSCKLGLGGVHGIRHFHFPDRVATCTQVESMGHACFFFLTEAKIPDRVATHTQVECMGHAYLFFLTEAKIPDRVATRNSGGEHGAYLFIFPDRGQNS